MKTLDIVMKIISEKMLPINKRRINASKEYFYEHYFSSEAKKLSYNKQWILNYCIRKAWVDATISERFKKDSAIIANKDSIIAFVENELTNNQDYIFSNFNQWHNVVCKKTDFDMRYGVWQKLINMTFKYLYCVKETFPEFNDVWKECHCPIDTIISKQVYDQLVKMKIPTAELELSKKIAKSDSVVNWNNITKKDYYKLQSQIKQICDKERIYLLEFDFLYWNN